MFSALLFGTKTPTYSSERFRVLTAEFSHETNTFCLLPTSTDNFRKGNFIVGEEQIILNRRSTKTALGGTIEFGEKFNWALTNTVCATATPSGKVTDSCYEEIVNLILTPLDIEEKFDGVILHLHGAMVTESLEDAEGELLQRMREKVGNIPIVVTLDLHGNITELMAKSASALIAVRTYPHVDFYERAHDACQLLQCAMQKLIEPVTVISQRPMLQGKYQKSLEYALFFLIMFCVVLCWVVGLDGGKTDEGGPMKALIKRGEVLEADRTNGVLVVSICAGFTGADVYNTGPSVTVTVDITTKTGVFGVKTKAKQIAMAQKIADDFIEYAWERRDYSSEIPVSIVAAIAKARARQYDSTSSGLYLMADVSDNPGSGHYGDATDLLKAMIDCDLQDAVFYAIYDPKAVKRGVEIGVGNVGTIKLGGRHDASAGGGPLSLTGEVMTLTNGKFQAFGVMCGGVTMNMG